MYITAAYEDERAHVETMYTSLVGSNVARASAILSTISSVLIIIMILRSATGLSITYHRIMFGMSLCDIIASIAMALTTLPMPKDMIYTGFEGRRIGSISSCDIQSYLQNIGTLGTLFYNVALSIYYLYSVRTDKKKLRISFEAVLHFICIAAPVAIVMAFAKYETTNPTPYLPWCGTFQAYPYWCVADGDASQCIRGDKEGMKKFVTAPLFGFLILAVMVLMFMTVWNVYQQERLAKMYAQIYTFNMNSQDQIQLERSKRLARMSKAYSIQAAFYVLALFISQSGVFLRATARSLLERSVALQVWHLISRPIQGFFNLIVFVGDKVYSHRRGRPEIGFFQACVNVLTKSQAKSFIFSHMSMLRMDQLHEEIQDEHLDDDLNPTNIEMAQFSSTGQEENEGAVGTRPLSAFPFKIPTQNTDQEAKFLSEPSSFGPSTTSFIPASNVASVVVSDGSQIRHQENEQNKRPSRRAYYTNIRDQDLKM